MTKQDAKKLAHGIYIFQWKDASYSLVAVGSLHNGDRWFAPTNWTSRTPEGIASTDWSLVAEARIVLSKADIEERLGGLPS